MSPFKQVKKQYLSSQVIVKRLQRSKILFPRFQDSTLLNLVNFNTQNDPVWSRDADERSRVVTRKQFAASVIVWEKVR